MDHNKPRYQVIKSHLLDEIRNGTYKPQERIPSEHKLADQFGVSRLTVQRAIRDLVGEGFLRRAQGSGTFVTSATPQFSLIEVRDLVEQIRNRGGTPKSEVVLQRRVTPESSIADLLELPSDTEAFHAAIVQSMDDVPVAYEERFAITDIYPDFLEQDFSRNSVFEYFASRSALQEIENVVSAILPERRVAQLLEIDEKEPCLQVQRRNWYNGKAVTLTRFTYAGPRQVLASRYRP